jgi:hypothetical protein
MYKMSMNYLMGEKPIGGVDFRKPWGHPCKVVPEIVHVAGELARIYAQTHRDYVC